MKNNLSQKNFFSRGKNNGFKCEFFERLFFPREKTMKKIVYFRK
jgi:hypothetical protein